MTGYQILSRIDVREYRCAATHLRHEKTGCEVLHLASDDTENLFAFSFATPPADDTGIAHILEHSVLSGSKRFPLKEPFSALLKSSLNTFLNALTYPDRTIYPAASCNRADFFNLLSVYGDAVFFPLLRKETFMQEAWRLEPVGDGKAAGFQYAGVVYNEMKGAYSSPDSVVGEWTYRSLLPDTPYGFDSGGDPKRIPGLTLEALRTFHARYYHPSNCRIFLYGSIPLEEVLRELDGQFLGRFTAAAIDSTVPLQPRWAGPRRVEKTFPVRPETPLAGRSTVSMSWLLPPVTDPLALVTHDVLSEILVGSAGSPLRKALIDSGLGEDLSPVTGVEADLREMVFAAGLRGTDPDKEKAVETLLLETLDRLASEGLDPGLVQSMVNRVEFRNREIRGNGGPYALRLMGRCLRGWTHGLDPVESLAFTPAMEELKKRIASGKGYLEAEMRRHLVDNPHRVTLVVRPDAGQEERERAEAAAALAEVVKGLTADRKAEVIREAADFASFQARPDSPEDLARVPAVHRRDVRKEVERIPGEERSLATDGGSTRLLLHDIFTNDIVYLDICFPLPALAERQLLLLPLLGRAVTGCGLPGTSYDRVSLDLFRLTGGFTATLDSGGVAGAPGSVAAAAVFRTRCLRQNLAEAVDLVARLLVQADFRDTSRLADLVLEHRNGMKSALIPSGHHFAMLRAAGMLSASVAVEERWKGVTQLEFVNGLASRLEADMPRLVEDLEALRAAVACRGNAPAAPGAGLVVNATAAAECFPEIEAAVKRLAQALPPSGTLPGFSPSPVAAGARAESLVTSATVGYAARAVPGMRYEDPVSGHVAVLGHVLTTGWLWEKVRMEGGAYGAFAYPRNLDGLFLFGSYRDPRVAPSLKAFREGLEMVARGGLDEAEVEKAVIGAVGGEDKPLDPGEKGFVSLQRQLHGVTDAIRQARRDVLLASRGSDLAAAARLLLSGWDRGASAVIASRAALADATREIPELGQRVGALPE
jgi:hypothetical protein